MSRIPENLKDLKRYFVHHRPGTKISIRGFVGPKRDDGYHLAESDIFGQGGQGEDDYSIQRPRDRAGLDEFASAYDITLPDRLEMSRLTAWMLDEAKAGRLDIWEFGGPAADGNAYWWWKGKRGKWRRIRLTGKAAASHKGHIHVSKPRDRDDDVIAEWEPFFGPRPVPLPPDDGQDPEPDEEPIDLEARIEELEAELAAANAQLVETTAALTETREALAAAESRIAAKDEHMRAGLAS